MQLACHVDAPDGYAGKARYALETMLRPLGIEPEWIGSGPADGQHARADLYYGTDLKRAGSARVALRLSPEATLFFAGREMPGDSDFGAIQWDGSSFPALFPRPDDGEPDLVASAFLWLSAWQEWVQAARDQLGRFRFCDSLQCRLGIKGPIVDAYREILAGRLEKAGFRLERRKWGDRTWAFCPTFDVDYTRKWRPGMVYREVVLNLVRNARTTTAAARLRRFGAFLADALTPGDPYVQSMRFLADEVTRVGGRSTVFLKAGAHGPYDVSYRLESRRVRRFLAATIERADVGLHPSFYAHTHPGYLQTERDRLARRIGRRPVAVRQHYLRYEWPATVRAHERAGFEIDSTLGFHEHEGFRNGTCVPYRIYDLDADRVTRIWEVPLATMDGMLFNRRGFDVDGAVGVTSEIFDDCRSFGGVAVCLWHNTVLDELDEPGRKEQFTRSVALAAESGALIESLQAALASWK